MGRTLAVQHLGLVDYDEAASLQRAAVVARQRQQADDALILLQHPHVMTLGVRVRDDWSHIIASSEELARLGVTVHQSGRGGDVTYHGPGQLVGYPILELPPGRRDLHRYVRDLEEVLIRTVGRFGIASGRIAGLTGVWVGDEKIAAIGVRIARWVTSHGFALNVTPDLNYFRLIVPCGITDRGVTSLARLLGRDVDMNEVEAIVEREFRDVFGFEP
ncbi:MAG: lipoyl(octanoyl) transferase LipB [Vicinamibacterales bacterium]